MTSEIARSFAEFEALNLAGGRLGQPRNKFHAAWPFVIWKMRHDKFLKTRSKLCIANKSCLEHDPSDRLGQTIFVLIRHDSDFRHARMLHQDALDLRRAHPCAADLEHVVGPAIEPVVTVVVLMKLVTGGNPIPLDRLFGSLVAVPVSRANRIAFDPQS